MSDAYLERIFQAALPSFAGEWRLLRATYPSDAPPSAAALLGALHVHVGELLSARRVAESARFFATLERLLADADPVLEELLLAHLVVPLARECAAREVDTRLVLPHLGPRTRDAWPTRA
jgi:hypothetical protein